MIGVPDFAAGAMENWGLVTYREVTIFADSKSSLDQKQLVAIVVAHELAHQWFGNLVTMSWWDNLWLNEGFACFMEYLSTNAVYPNWKMWGMFLTREYSRSRAAQLDAMKSSHRIEVDVYSAADIDEIFDTISYCKGAAVIKFVLMIIGRRCIQF